jgi:hypothetical protein
MTGIGFCHGSDQKETVKRSKIRRTVKPADISFAEFLLNVFGVRDGYITKIQGIANRECRSPLRIGDAFKCINTILAELVGGELDTRLENVQQGNSVDAKKDNVHRCLRVAIQTNQFINASPRVLVTRICDLQAVRRGLYPVLDMIVKAGDHRLSLKDLVAF